MALDDSDEEHMPAPPHSAAPPDDEQFSLPLPPSVQVPLPQPAIDETAPPLQYQVGFALPKAGQPALATFNMASFNAGDPTSWAALAQAFYGSTGREPNQVDLMQFLTTGEVAGGSADGEGMADVGGNQEGEDGRGRDGQRRRGRERGRGGRGGL